MDRVSRSKGYGFYKPIDGGIAIVRVLSGYRDIEKLFDQLGHCRPGEVQTRSGAFDQLEDFILKRIKLGDCYFAGGFQLRIRVMGEVVASSVVTLIRNR